MQNMVKLIFLFVLATVCHWMLATFFARWGLSVNMMLVFVVAFCAFFKLPLAYSIAFFCGLFLDFFGTKLFGNNAFTFTICACLVCNIAPRFDFDEIFPQTVAVFALTWVAGILNTMLLTLFASTSVWPGFLSLLGGSIVDSLCAPFVFLLVRRVMGNSLWLRQV